MSRILSGSRIHHAVLRQELCRYMVTKGKNLLQLYLSTKYKNTTTVIDHLLSNSMLSDSIWATDIEIVAMSILLKTDIYIAGERYNQERSWKKVSWLRYQGSPENTTIAAIYIKNFEQHFEPVVGMINSPTPSYSNEDNCIDCINLIELFNN